MNCTVCGKPHTPEAPLTIAHNNEWLCPGCLKELDNPGNGPISGYGPSFKVGKDDMPLYGKSPIDVAEQEVRRPTGFVLSDRIFTAAEIKTAIITTNATVKIGNLELPIERFEIQ